MSLIPIRFNTFGYRSIGSTKTIVIPPLADEKIILDGFILSNVAGSPVELEVSDSTGFALRKVLQSKEFIDIAAIMGVCYYDINTTVYVRTITSGTFVEAKVSYRSGNLG